MHNLGDSLTTEDFYCCYCGERQMHLFRTKSREEKMVDYLVGAGLSSELPGNDATFYCLAGSCSSISWSTKPRARTKPTPVVDDRQLNLCDDQKCISPEIVDHAVERSVIQVKGDTINDDVLDKIFKPKLSLPVPLFQETFRRWKSGMDMQLRFRRLRRLQAAIVLQPLDEFPSFLTDFQVQLPGYGHFGFFGLLHEFMKVFFTGANIHLNSTTSSSAWHVTSRVHTSTGKQQVLDFVMQYFDFCSTNSNLCLVVIIVFHSLRSHQDC